MLKKGSMKFNRILKNSQATTNYEGAKAYRLDPKLELYAAVVASSLSKTFYEDETDRLKRIQALIEQVVKTDPAFVARLAVYTREKMYLRSLPLVLTVELAKQYSGDDLLRRTTRRVVQRTDEITELLAYYQIANSRNETKKLNKLSKQLQKGLADAFNKFDEYQFAKYNRSAAVTLKDALFLVHPKAKNEAQQALFDKIVNDELSTAYTWETQLSATGQKRFEDEQAKQEAFKEKWSELVMSEKMGYMALLRNLRNILEAEVNGEVIEKVTVRLADPAQVRRSKQLPFRFLSAFRQLKAVNSGFTSQLLEALELAALASVENLKGFDVNTRVLIASDTSGSMCMPLSKNSTVQLIDVGILLSMLLKAKCRNVLTGIFGTDFKLVNAPNAHVLSNVEKMSKVNVGWATNGYKVIDHLIKRKLVMDKVMIFTDLQLWNTSGYGAESKKTIESQWKLYKQIAPDAKIYLFDLAGYGQAPLNTIRDDVFMIAGWSNKIFETLAAIEAGSSAVQEIEKVVI